MGRQLDGPEDDVQHPKERVDEGDVVTAAVDKNGLEGKELVRRMCFKTLIDVLKFCLVLLRE